MPKLKINLPTRLYFTRVPNVMLDHVMPRLGDTELRLLLVLLRATTGWNRDGFWLRVTHQQLSQRTGRSMSAVHDAVKRLESRGLIHRERRAYSRNRQMAAGKWSITNKRNAS